jgi:replicative DNA helicase
MDNPPQSSELERAVLGAMLISKEAIDITIEVIDGSCFYKPQHQSIYNVIMDLHSKDIPVDPLIVIERLKDKGELDLVGGEATVFGIVQEISSAANVRYHCMKLKEKSKKRKLIALGTSIRESGYDESTESEESITSLMAELQNFIDDSEEKPYYHLNDLLSPAYNKIQERMDKQGLGGIDTGFKRLNKLTGGWGNGNLIVIAAKTSQGKTSMALNFALTAAKKECPVGIFSMEMQAIDLVQRLMSSEGRVNIEQMPYEEDIQEQWGKLARASQRLYGLPIIIDDTAGLTITKLSAKANNMQKKYDIQLLVVDYLQIMDSEKKENRQLEVASISRGLKRLAMSMGIPIIALSQFNREIDKVERRPQLSDLRECVALDTAQIYYSDSIHSVYEYNKDLMTLDVDNGGVGIIKAEYIPKINNIVFRVKTSSGRFVDATANHLVLTSDGYKKVSDLSADDSVATLIDFGDWGDKQYILEAKFIGWMLGNGSMVGYPAPSFITNDREVADEFCDFVLKKWGFYAKIHHNKCDKVFQYDLTYNNVRTSEPNITKKWCIEHDLWGRTAKDKYIPDWFMEKADKQSIIELITGLWETDGSVDLGNTHRRFSYSSTSKILANQILYLLAKLGIFAYIDAGCLSKKATTECYKISIECKEFCEKFNKIIKMTGYKGIKQKNINKSRESYFTNVVGIETAKNIDKYIHAYCPRSVARIQTHGHRRTTKSNIEKNLNAMKQYSGKTETSFDWLCSNNIVWDKIESVEEIGEKKVFDMHVKNTHNFVVNGIVVHNSGAIEQDSDKVIFIHNPTDKQLENYKLPYQSQEEIQCVREIMVAKNRGGKTGTILLTWKEEFTTFYNLEY